MAVTAAKSVMPFRVLTMAVDLCRLTTRTMNVNAGHERTSKARIIHQIQLIRGITDIIGGALNPFAGLVKGAQLGYDTGASIMGMVGVVVGGILGGAMGFLGALVGSYN